jgi:hypothetical protein
MHQECEGGHVAQELRRLVHLPCNVSYPWPLITSRGRGGHPSGPQAVSIGLAPTVQIKERMLTSLCRVLQLRATVQSGPFITQQISFDPLSERGFFSFCVLLMLHFDCKKFRLV